MNISDLNNKIYGYKNLKEGEYANFIMESIEQREITNFNSNNKDNELDEIKREIKF